MSESDRLQWTHLADVFAGLAEEIADNRAAIGEAAPSFEDSLDMKYAKQAHEIDVRIEPD